jgi:hypothetical protein
VTPNLFYVAALAAPLLFASSMFGQQASPPSKQDSESRHLARPSAVAGMPKLSEEAKSWVEQRDNWPVAFDGRRTLEIWDEDGKVELLDNDLAALRLLPKVNSLGVNSYFSDAGLHNLRGLKNLEYLRLYSDIPFTDAAATDFATISNLRALGIWQYSVDYYRTYRPDYKLKYFDDDGLLALRTLKRLQSLTLYNVAITASGLRALKDFSELRELRISSTELTWTALAKLPRMPKLDTLEFSAKSIVAKTHDPADNQTSQSAAMSSPTPKNRIAQLATRYKLSPTAIRWLTHHTDWLPNIDEKHYIVMTKSDKLSDGDLGALCAMPDVNRIWIKQPFTEKGLANLHGLSSIEYLSIGPECRVTDHTLAEIATMANLRELEIIQQPPIPNDGKSCIDDAGLAALSRLPKLRVLKMQHVNLTNVGLHNLKTFPELQELRLSGPKLTWNCLANFPLPRFLETLEISCPPIEQDSSTSRK